MQQDRRGGGVSQGRRNSAMSRDVRVYFSWPRLASGEEGLPCRLDVSKSRIRCCCD